MEIKKSYTNFLLPLTMFIIFVIYCLTVKQSIPGGDSGEFILIADSWGVAHPPGYPLYTILINIVRSIPIGELALRINFLSVLLGLASSFILYKLLFDITRQSTVAIFSTLLFSLAPIVWTNSTVAEVFVLNNLIALLILWTANLFFTTSKIKYLYWGAFLFGIGVSNHHTIILLELVIFIFVLIHMYKEKIKITPSEIFLIPLCSIIGLLPYLYLPIATQFSDSLFSWGKVDSFSAFLNHFFRADYGTFSLAKTAAVTDFLTNIKHYSLFLLRDTLYIGPILLFMGLINFFKSKDLFKQAILFSFLFYVIIFHSLSNIPFSDQITTGIVARFWQMPLIFISIIIGTAWGKQISNIKLQIMIIIIMFIVQVGLEYKKFIKPQIPILENHAITTLNGLPQKAILLVRGDIAYNTFHYIQTQKNIRKDIAVIDQELMTYKWETEKLKQKYTNIIFPGNAYSPAPNGFLMNQFLISNLKNFRIFVLNRIKPKDKSWMEDYEIIPFGFSDEIISKNVNINFIHWMKESSKQLPTLNNFITLNYYPNEWEWVVCERAWNTHYRRAFHILKRGIRNSNSSLVKLAANLFEKLEQSDRFPPHSKLYKHLGVSYQLLRKDDPNAATKMVQFYKKYLPLAQESSELKRIRKIINQTNIK